MKTLLLRTTAVLALVVGLASTLYFTALGQVLYDGALIGGAAWATASVPPDVHPGAAADGNGVGNSSLASRLV